MSNNLDVVGSKRRKRSGERVFRFKSFGENGNPVEYLVGNSFRENVKGLLEYGHLESNLCRGLQSWSFQLEVHRHPPFHVLLFVVEEPIEASKNFHCKQCQYVGWGHHMICNKKYHFLLPSKETMLAACFNCNSSEDPGSVKSINLADLGGHIMHGVFHSDGFGHLLCVNGLESGSNLSGHQIMDFWDRLCTGLRARKVSLNDISQKRGMELRLIHGLAYGEPWFGRWGYIFSRGTFCVTRQMYQKAIEDIQDMPLCLLIHHLGSSNHDIPLIFSRYQTLSDHSLVNLGDLFHFLLQLKSRLPKKKCMDSYNPGILVETTCRWSPKRVELAIRAIVEALKRAEFRWVSRQEVRDAARLHIGDTGLLDFVLKSLGNHIVGNYLVRRSLNPVTKVLEYCLQDISSVFPNQEGLISNGSKMKSRYNVTRVQLMKDMFCVYKHILKEPKPPSQSKGIISAITMAATTILDSKYLVKEYTREPSSKVESSIEGKLNIYCTVTLKTNDDQTDFGELYNMLLSPPYECFILKNNATFDELKQRVETNFRDMYWGLRNFVVESASCLNAKGHDSVFSLVEVGRKVVFEGVDRERRIMNMEMYEGGGYYCVVDCGCGAKDDDGERMVCCDICEVWQHTRCVGIPNDEEIPHIFLCNRCDQQIVKLPSLP